MNERQTPTKLREMHTGQALAPETNATEDLQSRPTRPGASNVRKNQKIQTSRGIRERMLNCLPEHGILTQHTGRADGNWEDECKFGEHSPFWTGNCHLSKLATKEGNGDCSAARLTKRMQT